MVIELDRVSRRYGATLALDGVSFGVEERETLGLVGPNGAGKTTAIRILLGLVRPDSGVARIQGSSRPFPGAFSALGYAGSEEEHYADVSAGRLFRLAADLRGDGSLRTAEALSERIGLDTRAPIRRLSRGNRQKVSVVLCLMGEPQIILMDEPTTGLDPVSQRVVLDLIREARARGAAILVSSHQLHDIEKVCDRICLIDRGRVRETVTILQIRRRSLSRIVVSLAIGLPETVRDLGGIVVQPRGPGEWEITTADVPSVLGLLMPCGILDVEVHKASLEQYFRSTVGNGELRSDGGEDATGGEG